MTDSLKTLDKWISIHTELVNYFQPVNVGFSKKSIENLWRNFYFGDDSFDNDNFAGIFLHWFALRTKFPGKRATIANTLRTSAARNRLSENQKQLLEHLLNAHWSYYKILEVDNRRYQYKAQDIWSGKEVLATGKNAVRVYKPGMVILSMLVTIEGVTFSVGSFPSSFKECVIPSLKTFLHGYISNPDKKRSPKSEDLMRKVGFEFFKIGGVLCFNDLSTRRNNPVSSIYDLQMASEEIRREAQNELGLLSEEKALNLSVDLVSEMLLNSMEIMGKSLRDLAKIPGHRELILEIVDSLSKTDVTKRNGSRFAARLSANVFETH